MHKDLLVFFYILNNNLFYLKIKKYLLLNLFFIDATIEQHMQKIHDYDLALKNLFSHKKIIQDLLMDFVSQQWVKYLNFSTLEKVNAAHTADNLRKRESDTIWRIYFRGRPLYLIILLEFQSSIEQFMAVRILTYVALIYDDLSKHLKKKEKLPLVFPFVLYTGEQPWNAPIALQDCFPAVLPEALKPYQPQIHYTLLDIGRTLVDEKLLMTDNLVANFIKIEQASNKAELVFYLGKAFELLKSDQYSRLRKAFFTYFIKASHVQEHFPDVTISEFMEPMMLREKMDRWAREYKQEGREEGKQEAIREERLIALNKILKLRYGAIPSNLKEKMLQATNQELENLIDSLLNETEKADTTVNT